MIGWVMVLLRRRRCVAVVVGWPYAGGRGRGRLGDGASRRVMVPHHPRCRVAAAVVVAVRGWPWPCIRKMGS